MNKELLSRLFSLRPVGTSPIKAGLYHYSFAIEGAYSRLHLRVEPDGSGMLIANATAGARLSPSGVVIAKALLEGQAEADILQTLRQQFRGVSEGVIEADLEKMQNLIQQLTHPGDTFPIFNLEDAATSPYQSRLMAPLEADLPLAEPEKIVPLLDRLWEVGIPHVALLVPANPEPDHLVRAVERAEDLGLICGVRGQASTLAPGTLLDDLAAAGVDYVKAFLASSNALIHDRFFGTGDFSQAKHVFSRTQELEVADVGLIPLVHATLAGVEATLQTLLEWNVPNVSFFAIGTIDDAGEEALSANAMRQVAALVEETAEEAQVRYLWLPPVMRNPDKSIVEQVLAGPRCGGDLAMRVEPDGAVIPPRGPRQSAGNLLEDPWEAIWDHPAFRRFRDRVEAPTRCELCPGLTICAADCPREPASWVQD